MYLLLLLIGGLGFLAMTVMGMGHGLGLGHFIGGHSHSPGVHSHAPALHAAAHHAHSGGHAHQLPASKGGHPSGQARGAEGGGVWNYLMAISPLDLFAMAFGAGATGELLKGSLQDWNLGLLAVLGALVFDFLVVRTLMGLMLRFASDPSRGLEGEVASVAEAVTRFDASGRGLVKLILDGQQVQLMARLEDSELANHISVVKGDKVLVVEVDPARNVCLVSRELAPSIASDASDASTQARSST